MISILNSRIFPLFFIAKETNPVFPPAAKAQPEFKRIFQTYHRSIFRLCFQVTKNYKAAEDLTVRIFAEFYQESDDLKDGLSMGEYLRRIAVSKLLDYRQ